METERKEKEREANDIYWLIYGSLQKKNNEYGRKNLLSIFETIFF